MLLPGATGIEPTRVREYLERHCPSRFREGARACIADPKKAAAILFTEHPPR